MKHPESQKKKRENSKGNSVSEMMEPRFRKSNNYSWFQSLVSLTWTWSLDISLVIGLGVFIESLISVNNTFGSGKKKERKQTIDDRNCSTTINNRKIEEDGRSRTHRRSKPLPTPHLLFASLRTHYEWSTGLSEAATTPSMTTSALFANSWAAHVATDPSPPPPPSLKKNAPPPRVARGWGGGLTFPAASPAADGWHVSCWIQ